MPCRALLRSRTQAAMKEHLREGRSMCAIDSAREPVFEYSGDTWPSRSYPRRTACCDASIWMGSLSPCLTRTTLPQRGATLWQCPARKLAGCGCRGIARRVGQQRHRPWKQLDRRRVRPFGPHLELRPTSARVSSSVWSSRSICAATLLRSTVRSSRRCAKNGQRNQTLLLTATCGTFAGLARQVLHSGRG